MDARSRLKSSAVISFVLHALVFSLIAFGFASCTGPVLQGSEAQPRIIEATAVHPKEVEQYYERLQLKRQESLEREKRARQERREAERSRADALRKKKQESLQLEKARRQRQQALLHERERKDEEARRLKEQLRRQEAERKKHEADRRLRAEQKRERERKAEEARLRKEREAEQQRKRAAEEAKRLAEEGRQLKMRKRQRALWTRQYVGLLRDSIERHWKKPPSSVKGGDCVLKVRQDQNGEVLDLSIVSCDGDRLFMRSVEEAVWKASPLPAAPSPDVFDANVELTFRQKY